MPTRRLLPLLAVALLASSVAAAAEIPITGRVLGPGGSPLPGAQVSLLPVTDPVTANRLDLDGRSPEPAAKAVAMTQGEFRLAAPRAGVYRLRVEAPGFAPRQRRLVPLLEPVDLPEVELPRDLGLTFRITDKAGAPIEGAVVHVAELEPRFGANDDWGAPPLTVHTGKDGTAHGPRADGDRTVLTVSAPGYLLADRRGVRGDSITVKLEPGRRVTLDVRSADGKPAADVLAVTGDTLHPLGRTDPAGRLLLAVPVRGDLPVTLLAADGRRLVERVSPPPKDREGPVRLVLPDRLIISGRVIDLETRLPLAGSLVWNGGRPWEAVPTDDGGGYSLGVLPGDGGVLVGGAPGYLTSEPRPLAAAPGSRRGPTLALEPAAAVEGIVLDSDGQPVAGATVDLVRRMEGGGHQIIIAGRSTLPHAVTSSRGRFRLSPVDSTPRYDLKAGAKGFATATREIAPLQPRRTLEDVRVELSRGRRAVGRVVDADQHPIQGANAALRLAPRTTEAFVVSRASGGPPPEARSAMSDANGRFEIAALPLGTFNLEVRRKGFARKTVEAIEIAEATEPSDLGDVVLSPGERLQGRVVDPAGKPVDGVEVSIVKDEGGPMMRFGPRQAASPDTVTAPDGWFSIEDLARGEPLNLSFNRTGFLARREAGLEVPRRDPLEVVLHASSKVSGTVVGPDMKPVPLAQVTLTAQRGGGVGGQRILMVMRRPGTADSAGRFLFEDVEPGKIALAANATGWQEAKLDDLEVVEGQDLTGVELPLKPGAIVEGRVFAPDGRPAVGTEVSKVQEQSQMVRFRGAATDGDGYYRIEGLAPGKVSVEATHESWARVVKDIDARPGVNALDLQFQGGQDVSGRVVDAAGAGVGGAWVRLGSSSRFFGGPDVTTDADGSFRFEGVGDGDYELSAGKRGYGSPDERTPVHVAGAPLSGLEAKLAAAVVVTGTVSGLEPDKLVKVEVRAAKAGVPWESSSSPVDRQGRYRMEDLTPGAWRLTASHVPSGQQARGDLTVPPGATEASLDLRFGGGITLTGRVVQGDTPVRGADLAVRGTDVDASGRGRTDSDGRFSVGGLDPGNYELELNQWESGLFHEEKLEMRGPRDVLVRIPTSRISGRVVDSGDRRPVSGVRISVAPAEGEGAAATAFRLDRATTTDLDGRFSISNVADGTWRVAAAAQGYAARSADVTVKSGRDVDNVSLAIDPTEGLSLDVVLPSGRPPDEVTVAVLDPGGRSVVSGNFATGENGRVRLSTVPPGSWELLVGASGSATVAIRASAPGGPIPVSLPPSCALDVRVPSLEGSQAVATATVTGADGRPYRELGWFDDPRSQWRLAAGRVRLDALPPGAWTVSVSSSDGKTWRGTTQTAPGTTAALTLE